MEYKKIGVGLFFLWSTNGNAASYYGVGVELGSTSNDISSESFPLINIEGRFGYRLNESISIEVEATATSGSTKSGNGVCDTDQLTSVNCEREDEAKRQAASVHGVYTWQLPNYDIFSAGGIGVVKSSYQSTLSSSEVSEDLDLVNAKSTDSFVSIEVGALFKQKHRVSLVWNSPYGNNKTGEFSYLGASYSYLIKWDNI